MINDAISKISCKLVIDFQKGEAVKCNTDSVTGVIEVRMYMKKQISDID